MDNRKKIIIISSAVTLGAAGYFIYTKIRNKKEINFIHASLDGRSGAYGSIEDFSDVFTGSPYISKIKSTTNNLILLRDEYITKFRRDLRRAISGVGTNEDDIKNVFRTLKDKVQIAQVSDSYRNQYDENLLDSLKGEMDVDSKDMKELLEIMISKPEFRVNK